MSQRSSLLLYAEVVLSFLSKEREALGSETARVHHVARRRGGGMAAHGAGGAGRADAAPRRIAPSQLALQSAWMLCSRATGPHNRICSLTNFRSSSGPPSANVTCWVSLSCLATPGSRNEAASSSANLLTIALGVPAGAKTPHQA